MGSFRPALFVVVVVVAVPARVCGRTAGCGGSPVDDLGPRAFSGLVEERPL